LELCRKKGLPDFFLRKDKVMNLHLTIGPVLALIAGIVILIVPKFLNFIVAIYLIIVGILGIFGAGNYSFR
jgi:hypothetical protein